MSSELVVRRPRTALAELRDIIISPKASDEGVINLIITIDNSEVNVRELNAYLRLIDKTYGRLSEEGLSSYSQKPYSQLRASFRQGSLEVIFSELLSRSDLAMSLIVIRFFLKYLPTAFKDTAAAYRDYEEGRMVRERRKQLRQEVKEDKELASLENDRKNEIVAFLDALYWSERILERTSSSSSGAKICSQIYPKNHLGNHGERIVIGVRLNDRQQLLSSLLYSCRSAANGSSLAARLAG